MFFCVFLWLSVVMERLVNELGSLLKMLDHETVSPATADKMASIRNILDSLQLSGTELSLRWRGQCTYPLWSIFLTLLGIFKLY